MSILSVAAMEVKRPSGSWTRVDKLRSCSLELQSALVTGGASSNWETSGYATRSWALSAEVGAAVDNAGLVACATASRSGEVLEIEAILGDGRRVSGSAYCQRVGRGGGAGAALGLQIQLAGSGKLYGVHEDSYPDAPTGLTATEATLSVDLAWNAVAGVDGYYVYWGMGSRRYPFWEKLALADLDDSANPTYTVESLTAGRLYYFTVTSYEDA